MNNNMQYEVKYIDKDLDGIIYVGKSVVKVPFSEVGDIVEIKYLNETKVIPIASVKFVKESSLRQKVICKYYTICGGCKAQHFTSDNYKKYKVQNVQNALKFQGLNIPNVSFETSYKDENLRRRVTFSVENGVIGFKRYRNNTVVDIENCPIVTKSINTILTAFRKLPISFLKEAKLQSIAITDINSKLDILISSKSKIDIHIILAMQSIIYLQEVSQIYWKSSKLEPLAIKELLVMNYNNYAVPFSTNTFLQASNFGEQTIKKYIIQNCKEAINVLDLFCGLGSYSFNLLALENIKNIRAYDIIQENILAINQVAPKNLKACVRNLIGNSLKEQELEDIDTIILNPPRVGAYNQVLTVAKNNNIKTIIMTYCSTSSFSRDLKVLLDTGNFQIKNHINVIDQFLYSKHVEILVTLKRV